MIVEIRGTESVIAKCKSVSILDPSITFTVDKDVVQAIIMVKDNVDTLVPGLIGNDAVIAFCKNGYNKIQRQCPMRHFAKCKGEKCSWYYIDKGTGDCVKIWQITKMQSV